MSVNISDTDFFGGNDQPNLIVEWDCGQCIQPNCWQSNVLTPGAGNERSYPIVPGQDPPQCLPLASVPGQFPPPPPAPG